VSIWLSIKNNEALRRGVLALGDCGRRELSQSICESVARKPLLTVGKTHSGSATLEHVGRRASVSFEMALRGPGVVRPRVGVGAVHVHTVGQSTVANLLRCLAEPSGNPSISCPHRRARFVYASAFGPPQMAAHQEIGSCFIIKPGSYISMRVETGRHHGRGPYLRGGD